MAYQTLRSTVVRSSPLDLPYEDRDPLTLVCPFCVGRLLTRLDDLLYRIGRARRNPAPAAALRLIVVP
jgi:hypothetical protein